MQAGRAQDANATRRRGWRRARGASDAGEGRREGVERAGSARRPRRSGTTLQRAVGLSPGRSRCPGVLRSRSLAFSNVSGLSPRLFSAAAIRRAFVPVRGD